MSAMDANSSPTSMHDTNISSSSLASNYCQLAAPFLNKFYFILFYFIFDEYFLSSMFPFESIFEMSPFGMLDLNSSTKTFTSEWGFDEGHYRPCLY